MHFSFIIHLVEDYAMRAAKNIGKTITTIENLEVGTWR
jgi:hypothetical protein